MDTTFLGTLNYILRLIRQTLYMWHEVTFINGACFDRFSIQITSFQFKDITMKLGNFKTLEKLEAFNTLYIHFHEL